eukprot:TRINITY_DN1781_c0_g2_i1.p2 TRINITY_DN1781_c0_g2~~TRINITY_DN1781_c0_g2_i1.p2  ORF type:complete len:150 (-),score=43.69 TRINITY_DN1781_c0_g2_i1:114-563(-)
MGTFYSKQQQDTKSTSSKTAERRPRVLVHHQEAIRHAPDIVAVLSRFANATADAAAAEAPAAVAYVFHHTARFAANFNPASFDQVAAQFTGKRVFVVALTPGTPESAPTAPATAGGDHPVFTLFYVGGALCDCEENREALLSLESFVRG